MPTIFITITFIVVVIVLIGLYVILHRREQKLLQELKETKEKAADGGFLEDRLQEIQARALQQEQKILEEAQQQASSVVTQAQAKASQAISQAEQQAQQVVSQAQQQVQQSLANAQTQANQMVEQTATTLKTIETQFQQAETEKLAPAYDEAVKDITEVSESLEERTQQLFSKMESEMTAQIQARYKELDQKMEGEWSAARQQIEQYKAQKLQDIDRLKAESEKQLEENILTLLSDTLKQTIHLTLSPKEHQKLVFDALEQAKENNAFTTTDTK